MKWDIRLELGDVYGGDGEVRYEPKERVTLSRTRTKTMVRDSIGIAVKVGTEEELKEKKLQPVNTFRMEGDTPILRLGGAHGKLWGAMKAAAKQLYTLGDKDFAKGYSAVVDMINVTPAWVPLNPNSDMRLEGIPQELKGMGGGMIVQYFDVIPRAEVTVTLTFPAELESKVEKLVGHLEMGTHLNKRRATIRVVKTKKVN